MSHITLGASRPLTLGLSQNDMHNAPQLATPSSEHAGSVFQIFVNCFGKLISVDVTSSNTIASVKKQVEQKTKISSDYQRLLSRQLLQDDATLAEYHIVKGCTLFLDSRGPGGGFDTITAPILTNKTIIDIDLSKTELLGIRPGLNLSGRCRTHGCSKLGIEFLTAHGFDVFNLRLIFTHSLKCPCCNNSLSDINIIFYDCSYILESNESRTSSQEVSKYKLVIYCGIPFEYEFIKIETRKIIRFLDDVIKFDQILSQVPMGIVAGLNLTGRCKTLNCKKNGVEIFKPRSLEKCVELGILVEKELICSGCQNVLSDLHSSECTKVLKDLFCSDCQNLLSDITLIFNNCAYTMQIDETITSKQCSVSKDEIVIYKLITAKHKFIQVITHNNTKDESKTRQNRNARNAVIPLLLADAINHPWYSLAIVASPFVAKAAIIKGLIGLYNSNLPYKLFTIAQAMQLQKVHRLK